MQKTIKAMETKYLQPSLEMIEDVFTKWDSPEEGKVVRSLVEEIRSKKYYLPELEIEKKENEDKLFIYLLNYHTGTIRSITQSPYHCQN